MSVEPERGRPTIKIGSVAGKPLPCWGRKGRRAKFLLALQFFVHYLAGVAALGFFHTVTLTIMGEGLASVAGFFIRCGQRKFR